MCIRDRYRVIIEAGSFREEYDDVHTVSASTPWISVDNTVYVYIYPAWVEEDISCVFTVTYRIHPVVHYIYYTTEKPLAGIGFILMLLTQVFLTGLNIALITLSQPTKRAENSHVSPEEVV